MLRENPSVWLSAAISDLRTASFVELDAGDSGSTQVMNFHQVKGREADAAILSFSEADYYFGEQSPFEDSSRLLYVALTRARKTVVVMLPSSPHPLVAPLEGFSQELP
jgi:DNA helicase-2/ATP-dependent DNA helicase PcrA